MGSVYCKKKMMQAALLALAASTCIDASAGLLRDRLAARHAQQQEEELEGAQPDRAAKVPEGTRVLRDLSYGSDAAQRFDVYAPKQAQGAPVIFLVHGGGWKHGDKGMGRVVENKVARWVPKGFIVVSTNYRMLPGTLPLDQAKDVAKALATVQAKAAEWGGDRAKVVLMGHSAGAHLVSLITASPTLAAEQGAAPWLGTVALDSAAFDVVQIMEGRHMRLYDPAFGKDPAYWRAASPYHVLTKAGAPMLEVCSSRRDDSCAQARRFAGKAQPLGMRTQVLEEDYSHGEINFKLGEPGAYTDAVEAFLRGLDPAIAGLLGR